MSHKKSGNRFTVRRKGRCSCGFSSHSLRKLSEHARSKGHTVEKLPENYIVHRGQG